MLKEMSFQLLTVSLWLHCLEQAVVIGCPVITNITKKVMQCIVCNDNLAFQPLQRVENEVEMRGEQHPVGGFAYPPTHHPPAMAPSVPLQYLPQDPLHQDLPFGVVGILQEVAWR